MPAGMVRPRASLAPRLGPDALAAYTAAGWTVHGHNVGTGQVIGPCTACRQPTVRYGPHGRPLCSTCHNTTTVTTPGRSPTVPDADLLAAALAHAERGWHVIPLRSGDKRPAFPDHTADACTGTDPRCRRAGAHVGWEDRATTDPDRIRRAWSTRPYGVGIACGPSGLVVVDLDVPKQAGGRDGLAVFADLADPHGGIDPTYTVTTGRGGNHLYYRHPDTGPKLRNTAGTIGPMVDTRAHGGYVVAAGSTVNGRPYEVTLDCDPAPLPGWLAGLLTPAARMPAGPVQVAVDTGRHSAYVAAAIRNQVAHLKSTPEGQRNHVLFVSAVALGQLAAGGELAEADVYAALEPAALSTGLKPGEIARTIASGLRTGARNPRTIGVREAA